MRPTKLQKYFRLYNKKYFDDSLPEPVLRWAEMKHYGHYFPQIIETVVVGMDEVVGARTEYVIELGCWTRKMNNIWRLTLLHEMVHHALRDKKCQSHGRLFNNEMKRLANVGAFNGLW